MKGKKGGAKGLTNRKLECAGKAWKKIRRIRRKLDLMYDFKQ